MSRTRKIGAESCLVPLPPRLRARAFTDSGGRRRFGVSVTLNGSRFVGSVLLGKDNRTDPGGVAALLESVAAFMRRG